MPRHSEYSHFSPEEWLFLEKVMAPHYGESYILALLNQEAEQQLAVLRATQALHLQSQLRAQDDLNGLRQQLEAANATIGRTRQEANAAIAHANATTASAVRQNVPSSPVQSSYNSNRQFVKLEIPTYKGGESEHLPRWIAELEMALKARGLTTEELKVGFAISKLGGRSKQWAIAKRMAVPTCFDKYDDFIADLKKAFQPPKCELRTRAIFLELSQGNQSIHDYCVRARSLCADITINPVDDATQVGVFLKGLKDGPVKTELFRKLPNTLDGCIDLAREEDYSHRQARFGGFNPNPRGNPRNPGGSGRKGNNSDGAEPMDLSAATDGNGSDGSRDKSQVTCFRCSKKGHYANECRVPASDRPPNRGGKGGRGNGGGRGPRAGRQSQD